MLNIFENFLQMIIHPFLSFRALYYQRNKVSPDIVWPDYNLKWKDFKPTSYVETMAISWMAMMINALYSILMVYLGIKVFDFYMGDLSDTGISSFNFMVFKTQRMLIIMKIAQEVFFPFVAWIYVKFWKVMIMFFAKLYGLEHSDIDDVSEQIAVISLASFFFNIIPFFGEMVSKTYSLILLYAGLKENLRMTTLQSLIVIFSPLIFLGIFITLFGLLISMLIMV